MRGRSWKETQHETSFARAIALREQYCMQNENTHRIPTSRPRYVGSAAQPKYSPADQLEFALVVEDRRVFPRLLPIIPSSTNMGISGAEECSNIHELIMIHLLHHFPSASFGTPTRLPHFDGDGENWQRRTWNPMMSIGPDDKRQSIILERRSHHGRSLYALSNGRLCW